jgi:protein-S-isoprenylcysteine O-methyltransferase Ste14
MLALAAVLAVAAFGPRWSGPAGAVAFAIGLVAIVAGGLIAWLAIRSLGPALTAVPRPREETVLREDGVYGLARHPIYGGLLLIALAIALVASPAAFVPWLVLAAVLWAKSLREEAWLAEHDPAYDGYRARVRRRFVPFLI